MQFIQNQIPFLVELDITTTTTKQQQKQQQQQQQLQ